MSHIVSFIEYLPFWLKFAAIWASLSVACGVAIGGLIYRNGR